MKEDIFDSKKIFPSARFDIQASQLEIDYVSKGPFIGVAMSQKELRSIREEIADGLGYFIDNSPANSQPARFLFKAKIYRLQWLSPFFGIFAFPVGIYKIDAVLALQIGADLFSGSASDILIYSAFYNTSPRRSIIAKSIVLSLKSAVKNARIRVVQK